MQNIAEVMGFQQENKPKEGWIKSIFYFIREFKINPLPEEYEVTPIYRDGKICKYKIKKLAMDFPLFNSLMQQMGEHYKREKEEYKNAAGRT